MGKQYYRSSYIETNATPGQIYNIVIRSYPPYNETSSVSFYTLPATVTGVTSSLITTGSFLISWTANDIAPTTYKVTLDSGTNYYNTTETSYLFNAGIPPITQYTINVVAENSRGTSP